MFRKKRLSIIVLMLIIALVVTACGGSNNTPNNSNNSGNTSQTGGDTGSSSDTDGNNADENKPAELHIWANDDDYTVDVLKGITDKYTEQTGISVKITPIGMNDQPQALSLDGPSGNGPDLFYQPGVGELTVQGLVQPMTVSEDVLAQYTEESVNALSYDGKIYGLPAVVETYALLYNKSLISEPPTTIAELEQLAIDRTDAANDEYGFLYNATDFYFSWGFMGGSGGYIFKEDGNGFDINDIGLNQEGTVKGVSLIQSWFEKGYLPRGINGDIVGGLFNQGKVAAVINGPWAIADHRAELGDDLAVAPLPVLEDGSHPTSFIGVKGWMLSAFSEEPEWATHLAAFLTNEESSLAWFEATGETPPNVNVLNNPILVDDPLVVGFSEQIKHGIPFPNVAELSHVWDPMANALRFASEGDDVQEVLDEAVEQIREGIRMSGGGQ